MVKLPGTAVLLNVRITAGHNDCLLRVSIMLHVWAFPTEHHQAYAQTACLKQKCVCTLSVINLRGHRFYVLVFSFL
jgi:hypothetical protein